VQLFDFFAPTPTGIRHGAGVFTKLGFLNLNQASDGTRRRPPNLTGAIV
jgi:hypothetical protein